MRLALVLPALLAPAAPRCSRPRRRTLNGPGKCYSVTFDPPLGWGYALGDAIDGWRCKRLKEGDLARTDK